MAASWRDLLDYVGGRARAAEGDERLALDRVRSFLRRGSDLARLTGPAVVEQLVSEQWKYEHNMSPGQLRALDNVVGQLGKVAQDDGVGRELSRRELFDYVRSLPSSGPAGGAVGDQVRAFVARPDTARLSGPEIVSRLENERWKLEHGLTGAQISALTELVTDLRRTTEHPATARGLLEGYGAAAGGRTVPEKPVKTAPALDRLLASAKGTVVVHTDTPADVTLNYSSGPATASSTGFKTFGDGSHRDHGELSIYLTSDSYRLGGFREADGREAKPVEAVIFEPVTEPVYQDRVMKGGLFSKDTTDRVRVGEQPVMVQGPNGPEPAVRFGYGYDSRRAGVGRSLPEYRETKGNRDGNVMIVHATVPKSVADRFASAVANDPALVRQAVERLVVDHGGLDRGLWYNGSPPFNNPARPPYDNLPADHRIHVLTPGPDGVVARPLDWANHPKRSQPGLSPQQVVQLSTQSVPLRPGAAPGPTAPPRPQTTGRTSYRDPRTERGER